MSEPSTRARDVNGHVDSDPPARVNGHEDADEFVYTPGGSSPSVKGKERARDPDDFVYTPSLNGRAQEPTLELVRIRCCQGSADGAGSGRADIKLEAETAVLSALHAHAVAHLVHIVLTSGRTAATGAASSNIAAALDIGPAADPAQSSRVQQQPRLARRRSTSIAVVEHGLRGAVAAIVVVQRAWRARLAAAVRSVQLGGRL